MSGIGNMGKHALRVAKNYTKGYSDTQTKVRTATSNDPWGPSGTQMNEIATLTFNQQDFIEIMEMLDKRLNDKGKNWRHVFKALTLLDYLLHGGSENVVLYFRENVYIIKTLKEFQYIDEYGKDQGANVRQKAKDISNLLSDESRLREERRTRAHMRDRMVGRRNSYDDDNDMPRRARSVPPTRHPNNMEDSELQRALELSKLTAAQEAERNKKVPTDPELEEAMRLSREEEARRLQNQPDPNALALFDDGHELHNNNANQIDLIDTSIPIQQTGYQPQFASFNPYAQQQEEYMRQQQQMQAQQQAMEEQARYEAMMMQQQQQQQMMMQQQQQQMIMAQHTAVQPIQPQMTSYGSNNPFAQFSQPSAMTQQQTNPMSQSLPSRAPSAPPSSSFNFNDYASLNQSASSSSTASSAARPPPMPAQTAANAHAFSRPTPEHSYSAPPKDDGQHAKLAALLAAGGGVDTFGNEGTMRVPIGSPFHPSNRLAAQKTGAQASAASNPFTQPQQQHQQQQADNPFFTI
ncbi:hypothetical protein PGT21_022265 [Puccinia graminis f. sp. tritici]|uniref:ENTH domain-containing protein n=1 Tax=Puccinia graminis f. sp. tritici TaxID=56615 RepID=A0A5B0MV24_PUCGR|nr:hypothetical protein PGT21_022265 [Puccinia graminis f. sp. tritici]KAA1122803.1 hypothetical protein PGTUg99_008825 [Puccinia graminis f. sp. tritici]